MKLKNVKIGQRVVTKVDYNPVMKGMTGTIVEKNSTSPFVAWDNFHRGHNGYEGIPNEADKYVNNERDNVCSIDIEYIKKEK